MDLAMKKKRRPRRRKNPRTKREMDRSRRAPSNGTASKDTASFPRTTAETTCLCTGARSMPKDTAVSQRERLWSTTLSRTTRASPAPSMSLSPDRMAHSSRGHRSRRAEAEEVVAGEEVDEEAEAEIGVEDRKTTANAKWLAWKQTCRCICSNQ